MLSSDGYDKLELTCDQGSDKIDILSLNEDKLKLQFDSFNIVTYVPFPDYSQANKTKLISNKLTNNAWYFHDSFYDSLLIEFKDSLEDKIVKYYLRDQLNAAGMHFFKNGFADLHIRAIWGVNYFNNSNLLTISEVDGTSYNYAIILEEISDSTMSGFRYVNGEKVKVNLTRTKSNINDLKEILSHEWVLSNCQEIDGNYKQVWDIFNPIEKGLKLSALENGLMTFKLKKDNSFYITINKDTLTNGVWRLSKSGKLIELTSNYMEDGHQLIRNNFISILNIDSAELKIYRLELIEKSKNEFTKLKFIETYKPTGGNKTYE